MMRLQRAAAALVCAGAACVANAAATQAPSAAPQGEAVLATTEVRATVTKIDQKTREVTLRTEDGRETTFVAGPEVKNLAQVGVGDLVIVTYAEALAYEVHKGGTTVAPTTAVAGGSAKAGSMPAAGIARQTTATVVITAIDPKAPTVTFRGPNGNTKTVKVQRPEKLQGVSVGDTVQLTYTEAIGIKVEKATPAATTSKPK